MTNDEYSDELLKALYKAKRAYLMQQVAADAYKALRNEVLRLLGNPTKEVVMPFAKVEIQPGRESVKPSVLRAGLGNDIASRYIRKGDAITILKCIDSSMIDKLLRDRGIDPDS